ncbi:MAG: type IV toxin-antitoxin system AbiEi family antitoxin domain-containing protein [Myxococcota bacterium]|nr:type IV toxin-antitoxin system AbiEi family antitoxin domain-containing protein [Myxococcota bacterium]
MANELEARDGPRWSQLYETAAVQEGHFTTAQAAEAGYYPQLLMKYLKNGRIVRVRRGVYRLVHFPPGDHEDLVVVWLWSDRAGVFSHETALALHHLSDALPAKAHLTLPASWKSRRLQVPAGVVLHFADLDDADRAWAGAVQITTPARTAVDCAEAGVSPELVKQAIDEGLHRGLFTEPMVEAAREYLRSFGAGEPR